MDSDWQCNEMFPVSFNFPSHPDMDALMGKFYTFSVLLLGVGTQIIT